MYTMITKWITFLTLEDGPWLPAKIAGKAWAEHMGQSVSSVKVAVDRPRFAVTWITVNLQGVARRKAQERFSPMRIYSISLGF